MSAAKALWAAGTAGICLGIDGDDPVLHASTPPSAAVLNLLSRHKAGIAEFDGGLSREVAEAHAIAALAGLEVGNPAKLPNDFGKSGGA